MKTILKRALALIVMTPYIIIAFAQLIIFLPLGLAHYACTRDRWHYSNYKVLGIWWTACSPCFCKFGVTFERTYSPLRDRIEETANNLWND